MNDPICRLHVAVSQERSDLEPLLGLMFDSNGYGHTALHVAVKYGYLGHVKKLKESMFVRDNRGRTPLFYAVAQGDTEIFRCLLPTRRVKNKRGETVDKSELWRIYDPDNYETTVNLFSSVFPLSFLTNF